MFFFKKKTNAEKNKTDREMIESNSKMMEAAALPPLPYWGTLATNDASNTSLETSRWSGM